MKTGKKYVFFNATLCQSFLLCLMQPYSLNFQDVCHGSTFHQCVFIRIQPERDTLEAALKTRKAYNGDTGAAYMPHVSLLYADLEEPRRCEKRVHTFFLMRA